MNLNDEIYNVFNSEGRLKQVEYALENVYGSYQIISLVFDSGIIALSKKVPQPSLKEESHSSLFKIGQNLYINITGNAADVTFIVNKCRDICADQEYKLDCHLSPDIFAKQLADKIQKLIQRSSKRTPAFAAQILGFENNEPMLYYSDLSAIEYPCFASAAGEDHTKMNQFLEKNFKLGTEAEAAKIAISTLLHSIGKDAEASEIEVSVVDKSGVKYYSNSQIEKILLEIQENY